MTNPAPQPDDPILLVHAYLDGELDPATALMVERRMAADPALAAEQRRIEALRQAIRERLPRETAPPELRRRIEAAVGLRRPRPSPTWTALAASIVLSMAVASSATWLAVNTVAPPRATADAVLASHLRGLMAPQPVDVLSSDRHTVKPWFAGRIAAAPRVIDLAADGFPLVGGRVDVIGRTPVATLVYRRHEHVISLLAIAPGAAAPPASRNGYNIVTWTDDGTAYWAISDLAVAELQDFARRFRTAP